MRLDNYSFPIVIRFYLSARRIHTLLTSHLHTRHTRPISTLFADLRRAPDSPAWRSYRFVYLDRRHSSVWPSVKTTTVSNVPSTSSTSKNAQSRHINSAIPAYGHPYFSSTSPSDPGANVSRPVQWELFEPFEPRTVWQLVDSIGSSDSLEVLNQLDEWSTNVIQLVAPFDQKLRQLLDQANLISYITQVIPDWLALDQHAHYLTWRKLWLSEDHNFRSQRWSSIMLWYLQNDSSLALKFLQASIIGPLPPPHQAADVLDLAMNHIDAEKEPELRAVRYSHLRRVFLYVIRRYPDNFPISTRTIWKIAQNVDSEARYEVFRSLVACKTAVDSNTLVRFSHSFMAEPFDWERALEVLSSTIHYPDGKSGGPVAREVCASLLRATANLRPSQRLQFVSSLKQLGLDFDIKMYTALIANASDRAEYETAWQIYDSLIEFGVQADDVTYIVLFKMCRRSNDFLAFRRLYREIKQHRIDTERQDFHPFLVTELIFSFFAWGHQRQFNRPFYLYRQYFDLQPLSALGLIPDTEPSRIATAQYHNPDFLSSERLPFYGPRPPPPPLAIAIMLLIFLRSNQKVDIALQVYKCFKERLMSHDPLLVSAARFHLMWDAFLKVFTAHKETLHMWPDVLQDMAQPLSGATKTQCVESQRLEHEGQPGRRGGMLRPQLCGSRDSKQFLESVASIGARDSDIFPTPLKPSLSTWSILLHAFVAHDQLDMAEGVNDLMIRHGLKPTSTTWNKLILNWSITEQTDKVLYALEHMKQDGWKWDEFTISAMRGEKLVSGTTRSGLGDRAKGGGLKTGRRLSHGGFELVQNECSD